MKKPIEQKGTDLEMYGPRRGKAGNDGRDEVGCEAGNVGLPNLKFR